jgi:hypothetical protein
VSHSITRRDLLKASLGIAATGAAINMANTPTHAADFAKPVPSAAGLTAYQKDGNIQLRLDNLPVLTYRTAPTIKYPYFYPLNGPLSGTSLTTESCLPYPHHRGLWLGCDPVNGGNYWADNGLVSGQIRSTEIAVDAAATTKTSVTWTQKCSWVREGSHPFDDERRITVSIPNKRTRLIDCTFKLTAIEDVSIKKAKHSFFAMRAASDISPAYGGTLMNSEGGVGAKGTYGKEARWCGYFGKRVYRPDVVEGIAIMTHPDNPFRPVWFTRDYGHQSASPFNFMRGKSWELPKGESITLKYRVVLHGGDQAEAGLEDIYKQWLKPAPETK